MPPAIVGIAKMPDGRKEEFHMHYEKYRSGAEWRWRLRAANNEIISSGEAYWNERDCDHAINLNKSSANAPVRSR
jgi:uncharacterized protein YegP (UPF0339 family)